MPRHQFGANPAVGHIENRVGEVRQLLRDVGQRGRPQHVAQQDAQNVTPAEAREIHRRRDAGAEKRVEFLAIFLDAQNPVEAARIGELEHALRFTQHRIGEKAAIGKQMDGDAQGSGRLGDALERGRKFLAQGAEVVAHTFRIGNGRQLFRTDHLHASLESSVTASPGCTGPGSTTLA